MGRHYPNLTPARLTADDLDRITPLGREQVTKTARVLAERGVKLVSARRRPRTGDGGPAPRGDPGADLRWSRVYDRLSSERRRREAARLGRAHRGWKAGAIPPRRVRVAGGPRAAVLAVARTCTVSRAVGGAAHRPQRRDQRVPGEVEAVPGRSAIRSPCASVISLVEIGRDGKARLLFANHFRRARAPALSHAELRTSCTSWPACGSVLGARHRGARARARGPALRRARNLSLLLGSALGDSRGTRTSCLPVRGLRPGRQHDAGGRFRLAAPGEKDEASLVLP